MKPNEDWVAEALAGLPALLTVQEAMPVIRTSRRQFYRLVASGKIHAIKATEAQPGRLLIPRGSLEKYLRSLDARAA